MLIYFGEVEKLDERLVNIKKAKLVMEDVYENHPALWQEFKEVIEKVEKR